MTSMPVQPSQGDQGQPLGARPQVPAAGFGRAVDDEFKAVQVGLEGQAFLPVDLCF